MYRIESLLAGRLFVSPQLHGDRIYFLSNLSGHLSLYAMDDGGSVPEPLLPPNYALQNPHLIDGYSYVVFPRLGKILVMLDQDGDENYRPVLIPIDGGFPEPAFDNFFSNHRVHCASYDEADGIVLLVSDSPESEDHTSYRGSVASGELEKLASSPYGAFPAADHPGHKQVIITEDYSEGDVVVYRQRSGTQKRDLIYGFPLEERKTGVEIPLNGIRSILYTQNEKGLLLISSLFDDHYAPAYLDFASPQVLAPVQVKGIRHTGNGELESLTHLVDNRYALLYNIDGCSWLYEGIYDPERNLIDLVHCVAGESEPLIAGMIESFAYDKEKDRFILSFSTATLPTQIYTVEGQDRSSVRAHTRERVLGIAGGLLSGGEDASFVSFDGTRVSARLYLPAEKLGFVGKRPLVFYIHGGPQGQERPDYAWFSMPLIQFLTLNGFAVFVPNVRGSTGYGLTYTKQIDNDWGGKDRLDHVHALKMLAGDKRLDTRRAGVVGRSYGGYMTLMQVGRHPDLWSAAVDMFGPFDLITFLERIPESWKPYFRIVLGDPEKPEDQAFLVERSPKTYIENLACPMLVIQGKNDPRVVERESHDLVEQLRSIGKQVEYLVFENEGHDVLKYENRVRCYQGISDFFKKTLKP